MSHMPRLSILGPALCALWAAAGVWGLLQPLRAWVCGVAMTVAMFNAGASCVRYIDALQFDSACSCTFQQR